VTNEKGTLPNFLVIGAMKAGTTSLYEQLRRHPQVFMPQTKESMFFFPTRNWELGVRWYERFFEDAGDRVAVGEASVNYTAYPGERDVPLRIITVLPEVRLVYLVRHPVDRMISHVWMDIRQRNADPSMSAEKSLLTNSRYLDVSRYSTQIERYLMHFPQQRLLAVKSEDLWSRREETLSNIFEFIGVDPALMPVDVGGEWNRGDREKVTRPIGRTLRRIPAYRSLARATPEPLRKLKRRLTTDNVRRPSISDEVKHELEDRVRDDVRRLHDYMEPDFDGWGIA
jgi:Sulfotransferase domain